MKIFIPFAIFLFLATSANAQVTRDECILTIQAYTMANVPGANPNNYAGINAHLSAIAPDCPSDVMNEFNRQLALKNNNSQQLQNSTTCNPIPNGGFVCTNSYVGF